MSIAIKHLYARQLEQHFKRIAVNSPFSTTKTAIDSRDRQFRFLSLSLYLLSNVSESSQDVSYDFVGKGIFRSTCRHQMASRLRFLDSQVFRGIFNCSVAQNFWEMTRYSLDIYRSRATQCAITYLPLCPFLLTPNLALVEIFLTPRYSVIDHVELFFCHIFQILLNTVGIFSYQAFGIFLNYLFHVSGIF